MTTASLLSRRREREAHEQAPNSPQSKQLGFMSACATDRLILVLCYAVGPPQRGCCRCYMPEDAIEIKLVVKVAA